MSVDPSTEINLSPPPELSVPLWRSLARNLRERIHPEPQPPLEITARPAHVGMLVGDMLSVPWYRTVFTSIGDAIAPDTLPPLELQSSPVDVGELISDEIQRGWWTSLVRNLADRVAPEKLPPLYLSSKPVAPKVSSDYLVVPRWSELIEAPVIISRVEARPQPAIRVRPPEFATLDAPARLTSTARLTTPDVVTRSSPFAQEIAKAQRELRWSHWREACWISGAAIQVAVMLAWFFMRQVA
jgi:hypothetical protein